MSRKQFSFPRYAIRNRFSMYISNSTITVLDQVISCFEISEDPEQLASKKPALLDLYLFSTVLVNTNL